MAMAVVGDERERRAGAAVDLEGDRALETDFFPLKRRPHLAIERGVVGFPDELTGAHAAPVDVAVAEA